MRTWKCRRSGRSVAARDDQGVTIVEAVLAGAILAVAAAICLTAFSQAANVRVAASERLIASEIANDIMQTAEAFGCGLPPGYDGVPVARRRQKCNYGLDVDSLPVSALSDVDFKVRRGARNFDVKIRMRWDVSGIDGATQADDKGMHPATRCSHLWQQVSNTQNGGSSSKTRQPDLLTRTVTVTSKKGGSVTLSSLQSVDPSLASPFNFHALILNAYDAGNTDDPTNTMPAMGTAQSRLTLTRIEDPSSETPIDDEYHWIGVPALECLIVPYLEGSPIDYQFSYLDGSLSRTSIDQGTLRCPSSVTPCYTEPILLS